MTITDWLDQAEDRAGAATEGPWTASLAGRGARVSEPSGYPLPGCFTCGQNEDGIYEPSDAAFIAAARTDLPAAIAALRAVLDMADDADEDARAIEDDEMTVGYIPANHLRAALATVLGVQA